MVEFLWITTKINELFKRAVDDDFAINDFFINRDKWEKEMMIKDSNDLRNASISLDGIFEMIQDKIYDELGDDDSIGDIEIEGLEEEKIVEDISKIVELTTEELEQKTLEVIKILNETRIPSRLAKLGHLKQTYIEKIFLDQRIKDLIDEYQKYRRTTKKHINIININDNPLDSSPSGVKNGEK